MRISEALNLKLNDVNLSEGIITLHQEKNNKDRLIPMADGLTKRLKQYIEIFHKFSETGQESMTFATMRRLPV